MDGIEVADGDVAAFCEPSWLDRPCDTLPPAIWHVGSLEMWTGEKIIFNEKSVIVLFFMEMGLDTYDVAQHDYFFYATSTYRALYLACL